MMYIKNIILKVFMKSFKKVMDILFIIDGIITILLKLEIELN